LTATRTTMRLYRLTLPVFITVISSVVSLLLSRVVKSEEIGVAYFALMSPHFPCSTALKVFDGNPRPALAILWSTFGNDKKCLNTFLQQVSGRPYILEIHPFNQPCRRNKRCESSEVAPELSTKEFNEALEREDTKLLAKVRDLIREIRGALEGKRSDSGEYILSTGLEDNYTDKAYTNILKVLRAEWDGKIVRNPEGDFSRPVKFDGADYIEAHSSKPKFPDGAPCIANLDGEDIVFPHRKATMKPRSNWKKIEEYAAEYKKKCHVTFLWSALWQGITSEKFVPPSHRSFIVSEEDVLRIKSLLPSQKPAESCEVDDKHPHSEAAK